MFNIAFNFGNIYHGAQSVVGHQADVTSMPSDGWSNLLSDELPPEDNESDSNKELLPENFEIELFIHSTASMSPIESPFKWHLNESISGYKNHVAELNSRPPKAA